jgi:ribosomal protein S18 acetylase RimI-like enzyme
VQFIRIGLGFARRIEFLMPANLVAIALRPEGSADEPFLLEVYASTRQEELEVMGWSAAMRQAFVRMQFKAQQLGYRAAFPCAEFAIIMSGGQAVGRIIVNRADNEFRLVDIALLPAHRGCGLGTALMQDILREAVATKKTVRLSVLKGQRAFRLYQRLGFEKTGEDGVRDQMEWRGDRLLPNDPKACEPT